MERRIGAGRITYLSNLGVSAAEIIGGLCRMEHHQCYSPCSCTQSSFCLPPSLSRHRPSPGLMLTGKCNPFVDHFTASIGVEADDGNLSWKRETPSLFLQPVCIADSRRDGEMIVYNHLSHSIDRGGNGRE